MLVDSRPLFMTGKHMFEAKTTKPKVIESADIKVVLFALESVGYIKSDIIVVDTKNTPLCLVKRYVLLSRKLI